MRKLVYVGYNKAEDEGIETTSYEKMLEYKAKGFKFKERLDEILPKREPLKEYRARMTERDRKIREKRNAEALV